MPGRSPDEDREKRGEVRTAKAAAFLSSRSLYMVSVGPSAATLGLQFVQLSCFVDTESDTLIHTIPAVMIAGFASSDT